MPDYVSIAGLDKAKVLAALYNAAMPVGLGFLQYRPDHVMTVDEAQALLDQYERFDYLFGRVIKVNFSEEPIRTDLYNRDNGFGAAELVVKELVNSKHDEIARSYLA